MESSHGYIFFLTLGFVLTLFVYHYSSDFPEQSYLGFVKIEWKNTKGCKEGAVPTDFPATSGSIGTWGIKQNALTDSCISEPIPILSDILEIEYATDVKSLRTLHSSIEAVIANSNKVLRFTIDDTEEITPTEDKKWKTSRLSLPKQSPGTSVQLRLINQQQNPQLGWICIRNRVNFYAPLTSWERFQLFLNKPFLKVLTALFMAISLATFGKNVLSKPYSTFYYLLVLCLIAFPVCFRAGVFFHWDEWHVLQRFSEHGLKGVLYPHNEHYLPLFFGFYYAENKLFQDHYEYYILVSIFLHVCNTLLLTSLLKRFCFGSAVSEHASRLLALMYMLNSLHSEVLHWAFLQSILLAQGAAFLALIGGWDFILTGRLRAFLLSVSATFISPFLFGNGFMTPVQLSLVIVLGALVAPAPDNNDLSFEELQQRGNRVSLLLVPVGIFSIIAIWVYSNHITGIEQPFYKGDFIRTIPSYLAYIFVGSEFGTVLRGLGLFPSLSLDAAKKIIDFDSTNPRAIQPELILALAGFVLSFTFLLFGRGFGPKQTNVNALKQDRKSLRFWLLGQMLIASSFVLPSFVRFQLGLQQALALRYQYNALVGLCILLLPSFLYFLERMPLVGSAKSRLPKSSSEVLIRTLSIPAQCALIIYFSIHLWEGLNFDYFTSAAMKNRNFIAELRDWTQRLAIETQVHSKAPSEPPIKSPPYEGTGTLMADLYPMFPNSLTPGRHPNQIYGVMNWLNPENYPLP